MAYVINDNCVSCGTCAGECPVGAISEGDGKYEIDPSACIECGACTYICPGRLHLVQAFRAGKQKINNARAAAKAAAEKAAKAAAAKKEG